MKRFIFIILTLIIIAAPFVISDIHSNKDEALASSLKNDIFTYYEDLRVDFSKADTIKDLQNTIISTCKKNDFKYKSFNDGNIIITFDPTFGYNNAPSYTIEANYSLDNYKDKCKAIAIALSTAKNSPKHGKLQILFTPKENGEYTSISSLDKKYLNTDNMINLVKWNKKGIFQKSPETISFDLNKNIVKNAPTCSKAYTISISDMPKKDSGDKTNSQLNPIIYLSDFLRTADTSRITMEIASFESKNPITQYPTNATVTVLVDANSEARFVSKLENAEKKFKDKVRKLDSNAKFTYEKVEAPKEVLSFDDASKLLSILFTIDDGKYATTEEDYKGDTIVYNNINSISISNNSIDIKCLGRSINKDYTTDLINTYRLASRLSDFTVTYNKKFPLWEDDADSEYITNFYETVKDSGINTEPRTTFIESECALFKEKCPNLNIVSFGISIEDATDQANALSNVLAQKQNVINN